MASWTMIEKAMKSVLGMRREGSSKKPSTTVPPRCGPTTAAARLAVRGAGPTSATTQATSSTARPRAFWITLSSFGWLDHADVDDPATISLQDERDDG